MQLSHVLPPPYDNVGKCSPEDDFKTYQSSARITVEYAFGGIDLRWGKNWKRLWAIFLKTLQFC